MKILNAFRIYLFLIALAATLLTGCKKDENPTTFSFQGKWSGTYTGTEDDGTWNVTIDESGVVSGSAYSNIYASNYQLTGNVNFDGQFYATFGNISFGGSFIGQITGNKMNGTWVNDNNGHTGIWSGSKEEDNEDPGTEKILYPSRIKTNGILSTEYFYDNNKIVKKINTYDTLGVLLSYNTFEYTTSNKLYKSHYFDKTGKSKGLYVYEYDDLNLLNKSIFYLSDTSSVFYSFYSYQYNGLKQCDKVTLFYKANQINYYYTNEYIDRNRVKSLNYCGDTLKATLNYSFDDKVSAYKYLSTNTIMYSPHNIIGISSPDIIANGGTIDAKGKVRLNFTNVVIIFTLTTSVYEYNSDNYPIKQTITYTNKPNKVDVIDIEYIK